MTPRTRFVRPSRVEVNGETFEIRFGRPGKPVIYRVRGGSVRRIQEGDPIIHAVAKAFQADAEKRRAARVKEIADEVRRQRWPWRWLYALGAAAGRLRVWVKREWRRGVRSVLYQDRGTS